MENEAKTSDFQQNIQKILSDDRVKEALHQIFLESEQTIATQIKLAETASPPFNEEKRRELFIKLLNDSGLEDLTIDNEGNTYAYFNKTDNADTPTLFLSAHLDSVFDNETDVTVTFKDGMYYGPGIYDDARGLAVVIALTKTLTQFDIKLESSLIIGATVGEEGPGDLRGAKHFFKTTTLLTPLFLLISMCLTKLSIKQPAVYATFILLMAWGGIATATSVNLALFMLQLEL